MAFNCWFLEDVNSFNFSLWLLYLDTRWRRHGASLSSYFSVFVSFSCFLFLKHDKFYQWRTADHSAENTVFDYSDVLLDIVVGGVAALIKCKMRRWGKQADELVKLRQRGFWMPLPSIHLANLRSLPNKMDKLLLLSQTNKDFSNSAALCFMETWLNDAIPDSALHLPSFQLFRADRDAESMGKSHGGGACFYINWEVVYRCNSVKEDVLSRSRSACH